VKDLKREGRRAFSFAFNELGMLQPYRAPLDRGDRFRLALLFALPLAFICLTTASLLSTGRELGYSLSTAWLNGYILRFEDSIDERWREPERVLWTEEEEELRSYRWKAPEVDPSLQSFVDGLNKVSGWFDSSSRLLSLNLRRLTV